MRIKAMTAAILFGASLVAAGCGEPEAKNSREAVKDALDLPANTVGPERTVEKKVIVEQTTKVIDQDTGQVLQSEKKTTPATVTKETQIKVDVGESQKEIDVEKK